MEIVNFQKDPVEGGLRLVPEPTDPFEVEKLEQQFVNFVFLKADPSWRKLSGEAKERCKASFAEVFDRYRSDLVLFSYSLVGFESSADLMFWRIGDSLDLLQEMTADLNRSELGGYLATTDNYLSVTKSRVFVTNSSEDRNHVLAGRSKYHFFYPCSKQKEWHEMPAADRDKMIEENFMVGTRFPNIRIHMTHALGFGDQDYLISFETDEPRDFLALAAELRETAASRYTVQGLRVYTCRQRPLVECLDALG
ncbi:MAG: chlorite dismutase family protein [Pyrinomonadaceae bacterium]|nr:chlorite dismutase family protein [Pyrinomonadaceae bacterium]